jgi:predicted HicB family RNase H-like nuclease
MTDVLKYKEFIGTVHYSTADEVFYGKIEGINDLIMFEGTTVKQLKKSFKEAVNDYAELCEMTGRKAFKSFKGSFNIRINPELHSKAYEQAITEGKSLNEFVKEAIEQRVHHD